MTDTDTPPDATPLAPDANPIDALLTMAKFLPSDRGNRGIAEIRGRHGEVVGYTLLTDHPEADQLPIFDCASRVIAWSALSAWVKDRGFEASGCRWERRPFTATSQITFALHTPRDEVPALPNDGMGAAALQQAAADGLPPFLSGPITQHGSIASPGLLGRGLGLLVF